jgi:hypothetical protein
MAVTISLYNHTAKLFAEGSNAAADTYKVKLYTAATFNATHTTLADDVTLTASGGSITASFGVIYNDTDANDPPLAFIDFDGSQSAGAGTDFKIIWDANGIFSFTVA